jgi:pSer/pThr/pTyr-binding forkhead associated (FHA) protein
MQEHLIQGRAQLVVSSGDLVLRKVQLVRPLMLIGRRPYCDISLDDLTVSGEHAALSLQADHVLLRDLGSRNGVLVNAKAVSSVVLAHGDVIQLGVYRLDFQLDKLDPVSATPGKQASTGGPKPGQIAVLEPVNKSGDARSIALNKPITSVGGSGPHVAVVRRRSAGYFLTHLEGPSAPLVNGESIGLLPYPLQHNDLIELGALTYRFIQAP